MDKPDGLSLIIHTKAPVLYLFFYVKSPYKYEKIHDIGFKTKDIVYIISIKYQIYWAIRL